MACFASSDTVLEAVHAPFDLDLGVIDIDGQDWWVWHDMTAYAPRVMLVECTYRRPLDRVPDRDEPDRDKGGQVHQAGRDAIIELGEAKGYRAVAATPCNVLFVREDVIRESDAGQ